MRKRVVALVDDLVIHRAVKLRMRMQDHRDRRVLLLGRMITALEAACGAGENDFRPGDSWAAELIRRREFWASRAMPERRLRELVRPSSMRRGAKSKHLEHLEGSSRR